MTAPQLLVHAGTFAALSGGGDISGTRGTSPDGLFVRDARHLSHWRLTVDGTEPTVLVPAYGDEEQPPCSPRQRPATNPRHGRCTADRPCSTAG